MWQVLILCLIAADTTISAYSVVCSAPEPGSSVVHTSVMEGENAVLSCGIDTRRAMAGWARRIGNHCHLLGFTVNEFVRNESRRHGITNWPKIELGIERTWRADTGLYRCHAYYEDGRTQAVTRWVELTVIARNRTIITGASGVRSVNSGQKITLACVSDHAMQWQFSGHPVTRQDKHRQVSEAYLHSFLQIDSATAGDSGTYSCHADGLYPSNVTVQVVPQNSANASVPNIACKTRVANFAIALLLILIFGVCCQYAYTIQ